MRPFSALVGAVLPDHRTKPMTHSPLLINRHIFLEQERNSHFQNDITQIAQVLYARSCDHLCGAFALRVLLDPARSGPPR
jgi:hypothetical protein